MVQLLRVLALRLQQGELLWVMQEELVDRPSDVVAAVAEPLPVVVVWLVLGVVREVRVDKQGAVR
jgi:hypothetical protein